MSDETGKDATTKLKRVTTAIKKIADFIDSNAGQHLIEATNNKSAVIMATDAHSASILGKIIQPIAESMQSASLSQLAEQTDEIYRHKTRIKKPSDVIPTFSYSVAQIDEQGTYKMLSDDKYDPISRLFTRKALAIPPNSIAILCRQNGRDTPQNLTHQLREFIASEEGKSCIASIEISDEELALLANPIRHEKFNEQNPQPVGSRITDGGSLEVDSAKKR